MTPRAGIRGALVAAVAVVAVVGGCTSTDHYVIVTVDARPAVHDAATLRVTLTQGANQLSHDFTLEGAAFPVTFSISSPDGSGAVSIAATALDATMTVVGAGSASTDLDAPSAKLLLDSVDFVVNTEYAMDQYLTDDYEAGGVQMAATADGTWTVAFRDSCPTSLCAMHARRFDATGAPVTSALAAGTNQFDVSTVLTDFASTPAMAATADHALAFWDSHDDTVEPELDGISCRALDADGNAADFESDISFDDGTDVVSAAGIANGNVAVTWTAVGSAGEDLVRAAVVGPDCGSIADPITISTGSATQPGQSAVAASGAELLYTYVDQGNLHARVTTTTNTFTTNDSRLLSSTGSLSIADVRVAALDGEFVLGVRWAAFDDSVPGKIELYRVSMSGAIDAGPVLVTDRSGSDFASVFAFGLASRADGAVLVTWHACDANGDGAGCGVFARVFRPTLAPVGDAFGVPTTTTGDQTGPSAAAVPGAFAVSWTDGSMLAPDISGLAVRARVIYPPYDDAQGITGATCTGPSDCDAPLLCATGTDGMRCYEACGGGSGSGDCPGGGTCTAGACTF